MAGFEGCPLLNAPEGVPVMAIPEECQTRCELAWDEAVDFDRYAGSYDNYLETSVVLQRRRCDHADSVFSHDSLMRIEPTQEGYDRVYTVVDECEVCTEDTGEQGYYFRCT